MIYFTVELYDKNQPSSYNANQTIMTTKDNKHTKKDLLDFCSKFESANTDVHIELWYHNSDLNIESCIYTKVNNAYDFWVVDFDHDTLLPSPQYLRELINLKK